MDADDEARITEAAFFSSSPGNNFSYGPRSLDKSVSTFDNPKFLASIKMKPLEKSLSKDELWELAQRNSDCSDLNVDALPVASFPEASSSLEVIPLHGTFTLDRYIYQWHTLLNNLTHK